MKSQLNVVTIACGGHFETEKYIAKDFFPRLRAC